LTVAQRRKLMSRVRGKGSKPEMAVRSLLHRMGFRFRLHCRDLPGTPDIVLPRHRKIVLMHGCFWHRHPDCSRSTTPTSNKGFWLEKFARNVARDRGNLRDLRRLGWTVRVVWECQTVDSEKLRLMLSRFFDQK
jgi:DNA mismatch endonuclease (patch repair protein)